MIFVSLCSLNPERKKWLLQRNSCEGYPPIAFYSDEYEMGEGWLGFIVSFIKYWCALYLVAGRQYHV